MENRANNKLRCREGDLALIVREEPDCEGNIGRAVTVHGPICICPDKGPTWLIAPDRPEPWLVSQYCGQDVWIGVVTLVSLVEHPDSWLLPLRPEDEIDWRVESESRQRLITLVKG